ncbi:5291_t:CDS:2 [Funneliformis geosporum]|nr:5291_t:CDS:2 [Funneliformis geosporum]
MCWKVKLENLLDIAQGLKDIHEKNLIHRDFHSGNILNNNKIHYITDLGFCQPANKLNDKKEVFGVLPYVAPEVLRGNEYTKESDIYGFGIVAYEFMTGLLPYNDVAHEELLAIRICEGLRPSSNYKVPQKILDVIQQCWDADPAKRPDAKELQKILKDLNDIQTN